MLRRFLEESLTILSAKYPIVTLTGPRQSGKTTLAKYVFPDYRYVSMEDPDLRGYAENDPRGFLAEYKAKVILDEIQRAPLIFSYLQTLVDEAPSPGRYILTGSQQFLLNEKISQSLAGRTAILRLLPFSLAEIQKRKSQTFWATSSPLRFSPPAENIYQTIYKGFYPRVHDHDLDPSQWYRDYFETYISRDLRAMLNIGDIKAFEQFIRLLAGRSGQLLNLSSLGNDAGVSHTTARRWLSILEASYVIYLLPPHYNNLSKRIIKAPKIYFLDSGLLCYLLRISSPNDLPSHPLIGSIFETFVLNEVFKSFTHHGLEPPLYFWRDRSGLEIDLLIDRGLKALPVEIKSAQTLIPAFFRSVTDWLNLRGNTQTEGALIYGGQDAQVRGNIQIFPWYAIS